MKTKVPLSRPSIRNPNSSLGCKFTLEGTKLEDQRLGSKALTVVCFDCSVGWCDFGGWIYSVRIEAWDRELNLASKYGGSSAGFFPRGKDRDAVLMACEAFADYLYERLYQERFGLSAGLHVTDFPAWTAKLRY